MTACEPDDPLVRIIVRHVPEPTLTELRETARLRRQAFGDHLRSELHRLTEGRPLAAVLAVVDAQPGGRAGFLTPGDRSDGTARHPAVDSGRPGT